MSSDQNSASSQIPTVSERKKSLLCHSSPSKNKEKSNPLLNNFSIKPIIQFFNKKLKKDSKQKGLIKVERRRRKVNNIEKDFHSDTYVVDTNTKESLLSDELKRTNDPEKKVNNTNKTRRASVHSDFGGVDLTVVNEDLYFLDRDEDINFDSDSDSANDDDTDNFKEFLNENDDEEEIFQELLDEVATVADVPTTAAPTVENDDFVSGDFCETADEGDTDCDEEADGVISADVESAPGDKRSPMMEPLPNLTANLISSDTGIIDRTCRASENSDNNEPTFQSENQDESDNIGNICLQNIVLLSKDCNTIQSPDRDFDNRQDSGKIDDREKIFLEFGEQSSEKVLDNNESNNLTKEEITSDEIVHESDYDNCTDELKDEDKKEEIEEECHDPDKVMSNELNTKDEFEINTVRSTGLGFEPNKDDNSNQNESESAVANTKELTDNNLQSDRCNGNGGGDCNNEPDVHDVEILKTPAQIKEIEDDSDANSSPNSVSKLDSSDNPEPIPANPEQMAQESTVFNSCETDTADNQLNVAAETCENKDCSNVNINNSSHQPDELLVNHFDDQKIVAAEEPEIDFCSTLKHQSSNEIDIYQQSAQVIWSTNFVQNLFFNQYFPCFIATFD